MFTPTKLRECREKADLTLADLIFELDKVGLRISRPTLINWETGETSPGANDLAILAMFFGKPVQYFFDSKTTLHR